MTKCDIGINNMIMGTMNLDLFGEIKGINETTGDTITLDMIPRGWMRNTSGV